MENHKQKALSKIPPINQILEHTKIQPLILKYSHDLILTIAQQETRLFKEHLLQDKALINFSRQEIVEEIVHRILTYLNKLLQPGLKKVVNGTGIILHTGLGRAPLIDEVKKNIQRIVEGYCSLEIDLESGGRGDRTTHVEEMLCKLTGAEAACVVNNNAAAVLLTLNTLSFAKEAIISRGQLIEIGGSFRIPEVMEKSGARMVEVGTTNKTHLKDYEKAISDNTGLICLVHPSNYRVKGFTTEVDLKDVVKLGQKHDVAVLQDLGGGVLIDLRKYNLPYEPVVRESVDCGVDVITFSGDKVLGGPQSGIIVGKRQYLDKIKSNPLMRTLRCDKLIYAALAPTLKLYFQEQELLKRHHVLKMLIAPLENLEKRAKRVRRKLSNRAKSNCQIEVEDTFIQIGSGALPLEELPSKALSLQSKSIPVDRLAQKFRLHDPPIIGYIREDKLYFDFRTIFEEEEEILNSAMEKILTDKS
ncbi:MAG: L-seryl-tRNA(Sec) selenium transferase [bacterium]